VKDLPEAKKARNGKWNQERLTEVERQQQEIDLGRSIPKRIPRSALDRFLRTGRSVPPAKPKPAPTVVDMTPISDRLRDYWTSQGYTLEQVMDDPQYQAEILESNAEQIARGHKPYDPEKFGPTEPAHPYAYTPRYVTFRMRREQGFRCSVMGWHEEDWIINVGTGDIRKVGKLTRDHIKPASGGGETSAANLKMVSALANRKKGMKNVTYEILREHLGQYWKVLQTPKPFEQMTIAELRALGVKHVTF
jgi:hypothetical protein